MIKEQIDQDIKSAMLSGDKKLVSALKTLKSVILYAEVAAGKREVGLPDSEVIALLQKEYKKRGEAAQLYDQGQSDERAEGERYEQGVIQTYLPKQLTEDEIKNLIEESINELDGEINNQSMGKIIGSVKAKSGGAVDGALLAKLVKARISQ